MQRRTSALNNKFFALCLLSFFTSFSTLAFFLSFSLSSKKKIVLLVQVVSLVLDFMGTQMAPVGSSRGHALDDHTLSLRRSLFYRQHTVKLLSGTIHVNCIAHVIWAWKNLDEKCS